MHPEDLYCRGAVEERIPSKKGFNSRDAGRMAAGGAGGRRFGLVALRRPACWDANERLETPNSRISRELPGAQGGPSWPQVMKGMNTNVQCPRQSPPSNTRRSPSAKYSTILASSPLTLLWRVKSSRSSPNPPPWLSLMSAISRTPRISHVLYWML